MPTLSTELFFNFDESIRTVEILSPTLMKTMETTKPASNQRFEGEKGYLRCL
jgi:hypothetical protein